MATVRRVENYMAQGGIEEEELGIIFAPWYRQYEDIKEDVLLPEEDQHWEMHVHARDMTKTYPGSGVRFDFDAIIEYDSMETETMLEEEYPAWVEEFENSFPEAQLEYLDPSTYLK